MEILLLKELSILLNASGAGISLLFAFVFFKKWKKLNARQKHFALLLAVLAVIMLNTTFHFFDNFILKEFVQLCSNGVAFTIAPLLYLMLSSTKEVKINEIFLSKHLILFYAVILMTLIGSLFPNGRPFDLLLDFLDSSLLLAVWNFHFLIYLIIIFNTISRSSRLQLKKEFVVIGVGTIWIINLIIRFYSIFIHEIPPLFYLNITLLFVLLIVWYSFRILTVVNHFDLKYPVSQLPKDSLAEHWLTVIRESMEKQKLYKDPVLSIRSFSKEIHLPYNKVSSVINEKLNQNFNEFVNNYRVQEVMNALDSNQLESYTILGLAKRAGFRSASSFYYAFRKKTGMTPREYLSNKE